MNKIIKNVAVVTAFGIATRFLSFVYRMILSRSLTSGELGIFQITMSVFGVLMTLTSSGIPLAISRLIAPIEENCSKKHEILSAGLFLSFAFAVISSLFVLIFKGIFTAIFAEEYCYHLLVSLLPSLILSAVYASFRGAIWGNRQFFNFSLCEFIEEVSALLTILIFTYIAQDVFSMIYLPSIAIAVSVLIGSVVAVIMYFSCGGHIASPFVDLKKVYAVSSPITYVRTLSSFSSSILSLILPIRLMLTGISKATALSMIGLVSGVAFPMVFAPLSVISSVSLVLLPEISSKFAKGIDVSPLLKKTFFFATVIACSLIPIYVVLGREICGLLFDKADAGKYLIVASIAVLPLSLNALGSAVLNSIGGEKYGFNNFLCGVFIAIAFVVFATPYMSIYSLIGSMFLQPTIIFTLNAKRINKILNIKTDFFKKNLVYVVTIIPIIIIGFAVKLVTIFMPLYLCVAITCAVMLYLAVCFIYVFTDIKLSTLLHKNAVTNE